MSKKSKERKKLKRLIDQRLKEISQKQKIPPLAKTSPTKIPSKPEPSKTPAPSEVYTPADNLSLQTKSDLKKIAILVGILAFLMILVSLTSQKTSFFTNLSNLLFDLFNKS